MKAKRSSILKFPRCDHPFNTPINSENFNLLSGPCVRMWVNVMPATHSLWQRQKHTSQETCIAQHDLILRNTFKPKRQSIYTLTHIRSSWIVILMGRRHIIHRIFYQRILYYIFSRQIALGEPGYGSVLSFIDLNPHQFCCCCCDRVQVPYSIHRSDNNSSPMTMVLLCVYSYPERPYLQLGANKPNAGWLLIEPTTAHIC